MNRAGIFRSFLMTGIPLTGYLGYWQYQRWGWKVDLIEKTQTRPMMPPLIGLPSDFDADEYVYRRLAVRGTYRHKDEVFIYPRQMLKNEENSNLSSRSSSTTTSSSSESKTPSIAQNKLGACVVTPFELSNDGRVILVNRGYVGQDYIPPERREHGQASFEHLITGIIRDGENETSQIEHVPLVRDVATKYPLIDKRNVKALAEYASSLPVFIDLDVEAAHPDGPVGGQCKMTFPNNHCAYMIQWWALSLFMCYYMIRYMF